ncbi:MAG: DNA translocase FtsK [Phycisphaerae bacterium]|nr:DNA translocase FtsK [Phycisphaerae bacterium]
MVTRKEQRMQALVLCYRLVLLGGCGFCWLSLLTFDAADWPGTNVWPHPWPPINLCGWAGAWLSYQLFYWFGAGAYVTVLFATVAVVAAMLRGRINDPWLRFIGVLFLVVGTAASVRMIAPGGNGALVHGNGGIVGIALVQFLGERCSTAGTALIVLCGIAIGLLLAAEGLAIRLPRAMGKLGSQAFSIAGAAGYVLVDRTGQAITNAASKYEEVAVARREALEAEQKRRAKEERAAAKERRKAKAPVDEPASDTWLPDWLRLPRLDIGRLRRKKTDETLPAEGEPGSTDQVVPDGPRINHPLLQQMRDADRNAEAVEKAGRAAGGEDVEVVEEADEADLVQEQAAQTGQTVDAEEEDPDALKGSLADSQAEPIVRSRKMPKARPKEEVCPYPRQLGDYELPSLHLLDDPEYGYIEQQESVVREKAKVLERTLTEFRLDTRVVEIDTGPVITMYEIELAPGIKVSQIVTLSNDIARALKAPNVRVVAPLPGKNTIGIEVPNIDKENVRLKELLSLSGGRTGKMQLPLFLGKDASGRPLISDLAKMPHMLIAGTTGSGKSVCMNSIVMSVLMTQRPDTVKMILVDPKMVEMSVFKDVPHLMCPIVTDMNRAEMILDWATTKMDERYELLAEAGVRNIAAYNELTREQLDELFQPASDDERAKIPYPLPHMIIMIDELADLMMTSAKEVEHHLSRLAQKSRAVGIHIVVATQRPEAKVVTGLIKSNLPCRVAFRVASRMDSRIVLDQNGGEVLMGQGDMLFLPPGTSKLVRAQGTYVSDEELKQVIKFLSAQTEPEFHPELIKLGSSGASCSGERDVLFDQAVPIIIQSGRGSVSLLQRRLTIGYGRASRIIDQMAEAGIVGTYKGSQAREVMITLEEWEELRASGAGGGPDLQYAAEVYEYLDEQEGGKAAPQDEEGYEEEEDE